MPEKRKRGNPNWRKGETPPGAKPFQKGQSGNPRGSSRKQRLTPILLEVLNETLEEGKPESGDKAKALVRTLIAEGIKGNVAAIRETFDRADGKVPEHIDLNGALGTYDLSKLSREELEQLERMLSKLDPEA